MDYSSFKVLFASRLSDGMTVSQIMEAFDAVAVSLDIRPDEPEILTMFLDAKTVQDAVDRIVRAAGRSFSVRITPHVFRHTIATVLLRNGMPVEQVQRFLGHSNINTTMIYAEVRDEDVRRSHSLYAA